MARAKKKSTAIVSAELAAELTRFREHAQAALAGVSALSIQTQTEVDFADKKLKDIHSLIKAIEAHESQHCGRLREDLAARRALYKPVEECLEQCKAILKRRLLERAEQARNETDESVRAGGEIVAPVTSSAIREQEYWVAEVVDEGAIPDAFWILDSKGLDRMAADLKGDFDIPGARAVRRVRGVMA